MIGYYIHHHGHGHLNRARCIAEHLDGPVTGLSTLPRPGDWRGDWVPLEPDDEAEPHTDPTARGRLHWVPMHHGGLRARMSAIGQWLQRATPDLVVVDVSVEVATLVRLHGVPVVSIVVPGARGDAPHRLGYAISDSLIGAWPRRAHSGMVTGLDAPTARRIIPVGAISRFPVNQGCPVRPRSVTLLHGSGGTALTGTLVRRLRTDTPRWSWTILGGPGAWYEDPWPILTSSGVVVTHAGQNALAEVAAARRPAVVLPQTRPHDEQVTTASVLAADSSWPAEVVHAAGLPDWSALLERVATLDGSAWAGWCDGRGAQRAAREIERVRRSRSASPR